MEENSGDSTKYAVAYTYALELLEAKHPEWGTKKLSTAANLYVSVMIALAVTDNIQQQAEGMY